MQTIPYSRPIEDANYSHLVFDIAWFGIALAASSRFMTVFAIRLGASPTQIGLLSAIPPLVLLLTTGYGATWRKRYSDIAQAVFWPSFFFRFIFLLPVFTPFLPKDLQPWWLIASICLPALPQGVGAGLFISLMRESVPQERMTPLHSRRMMAMNIMVGIAALVFGLWLKTVPFPYNYQSMFLVAYAAALVSLWHVAQVHPLEKAAPARVINLEKAEAPSQTQLKPIALKPWQMAKFRQVGLLAFLSFGVFFAFVPLVPMHLMEDLGADETFMAYFAIIELGSAAMAASRASGWVRQFGSRNVVGVALTVTGLASALIAFSPTIWISLIPAGLLGAAWVTCDISLMDYFTRNTPGEDVRYSSAYQQVISLGMFIGPLVTTQLVEYGVSIVAVLVVGGILRVAAAAFSFWGGATPSPVQPRLSNVP